MVIDYQSRPITHLCLQLWDGTVKLRKFTLNLVKQQNEKSRSISQ
jgi:hypothetical protein